MALDIELICTDLDLEAYVLGAANLQDLLPEEWLHADGTKKTALPARQQVLGTVLTSLKRRRPPIFDTDLVDAAELKTVIAYGVLEILYSAKTEHAESPKIVQAKRWGARFSDELNALAPETRQGVSASSLSVRISRG